MDAPKLIENLFYTITIVSTFNCIVRSDYNFAFGLLCYYMIKTSKDHVQTAKPVRSTKLRMIAAADKRRAHYVWYPLVHNNEQRLV